MTSPPMIEIKPGATEPAEVVAIPAGGGPARRESAALTRDQRRLVDRVNRADGAWFRRHPQQREYVRAIVRGEFAPLVEDLAWSHVAVIRLGDQRVRLPHTMRDKEDPR